MTRPIGWVKRTALPILAVVAVMSLFLSVLALARFGQVQAQQSKDRIESDVTGCQSGNVLRGQIIAMGQATEVMVESILTSIAATPQAQERVTAFLAELRQPGHPFAVFEAVVASIHLRDCSTIPGAGGLP